MARGLFGRRHTDVNHDHVREVREVHTEKPVVVRQGGGLGFLGALFTLALIAVVLWAAGILDINLYGSGDGRGGGANIRLTPPDGSRINVQ